MDGLDSEGERYTALSQNVSIVGGVYWDQSQARTGLRHTVSLGEFVD